MVFKANLNLLANSAQGFCVGFLRALFYIVRGTSLLYNVVNVAGGVESISATLIEMTRNRVLQPLNDRLRVRNFLARHGQVWRFCGCGSAFVNRHGI